MSTFDGLGGFVGVAVGLVGIGYALGTHSKMAKVSDNLERSIDDLAGQMPVEIPKAMIERAMEKSVAYEVKQAIGKATDEVAADVKRDIHRQVSTAVETQYSNIKDTVLREVIDEASKIDANRVRADVERAAKEHALKKFDDKLDDIADDFKEKLNDYMDDCKSNLAVVNKVYKTFSDAMSPSTSREATIRLI